MTRFNDVQLAFLLGFYCGCSCMRIELQHEVEETISRLSKELRHEVNEMIVRLNNATAEVYTEMHAMRAKFARLRAISDTVETETDPARC